LNTAFSSFAGVFQSNKYLYNILVVLLAGSVNDKVQVNDAINHAKGLPISLIFLTVGEKNDEAFFTSLDNAKGDRDMVQFINLRKAMKTGNLGQEVLAEIPEQIIGFYKSIGLYPN
jgi:hypothetical protein